MDNSFSSKLIKAVKQAQEKTKGYCSHRRNLLTEYSGPYYGSSEKGALSEGNSRRPLNTIYMMASIFVPHLVFKNPRAMIRAKTDIELRPQAEINALRMNVLFEDIDLCRTLRTIVTDSLFGPGIAKIALEFRPQYEEFMEEMGYLHDQGQPYVNHVDLDDYIIDSLARRREEACFEGDKYRLPLEYILESGLYDKAVVEKLSTGEYEQTVSKTSKLSKGASDIAAANIYEFVELYDLWLPHENMVVTLPAQDEWAGGFLREVEWEGPESGPYEMLGYQWVPSNVLPAPPASILFDLHRLINAVASKMGDQAQRQKDILLTEDTADEKEGEGIDQAIDGSRVRVQSISRYLPVSFGGINDKNFEAIGFFLAQQSRIGGNLDLIGGMEAQSGTATQDQLLASFGATRLDDYQSQVHGFVKQITKRLAWYIWDDQTEETPMMQEMGGVQRAVEFSAQDKEGEFDDYSWDIEPYSMSPDNPQKQYERTMKWVSEVLIPLSTLAPQSGVVPDVEKISEITAKQIDIPYAEELWIPIADMMMGAQPAQGPNTNEPANAAPTGRPSPQPSSPTV